MPRPCFPALVTTFLSVALLTFAAPFALAVMDIGDHGPVLRAGDFILRVTNVGAVGNPFFDVGLSNDPSLEFPAYSGAEALHHAELWVGGRKADGTIRVSGGPLLEWRPTIAPDDRVREARRGDPGTRRLWDDDGDGRVDEETLNGRDDDGDGWIDEDLGLIGDQMLACDYRDDEAASIQYTYPGGEPHEPLHLEVHQEAYAWSHPDYRHVAGLQYKITNRGTETLRDLYVGVWADLDSRLRSETSGQQDDRVQRTGASYSSKAGYYIVTVQDIPSPCAQGCLASGADSCTIGGSATVDVIRDGGGDGAHPIAGIVPLGYTTDPLAWIDPVASRARAPRPQGRRQGAGFFHTLLVAQGERAVGAVPVLDSQRYDALAGVYPPADGAEEGDYSVLVSGGPFRTLAPGQSLDFAVALVVGPAIARDAGSALFLYDGAWMNALPDSQPSNPGNTYLTGETGTFGHEACIDSPDDVNILWDPHCTPDNPVPLVYSHDHCTWTNADCDFCTPPISGAETQIHWLDTGGTPPRPALRLKPGDHEIRVEWDDLPEVLLAGGAYGSSESRFLGYRIYKLSDWRDRIGEFPDRGNWTLFQSFSAAGADTFQGQIPLATVTDSSVAPSEVLYERPHHPAGRYRIVDREVLNGFQYAYAVTARYDLVAVRPDLSRTHVLLESPIAVGAPDVASPHAAARPRAGSVWVVPNPFRGSAEWDRPPILHDVLTKHVDFMGLPRARAQIRVYTLAGDLVDTIEHDGSGGDGEASWNLVSRNGQDVASGVYLFTVDSPLGHQTGRFVIIR